MAWIPEEPTVADAQRATGSVTLRFEDVSQDGRLVLEALPHALDAVWRSLGASWGPEMVRAGVVPILSRAFLENGGGPVAATAKAEAEGLYHLWHTAGPDGGVERIVLGMWARVRAPLGRTFGPPPPGAGQPVVAGRVCCEYVFTRPLGPPSERRVTHLEVSGSPWVPPDRRAWLPAEATLDLPEGAIALDAQPSLDPLVIPFGLDHTDSNQHVNSLVYTRLFLEAALRRVADHGFRGPLLAQAAELSYRKPCFAGERARIAVRAFTLAGRPGVVAALLDEREAAAPLAKARCFARLIFGD